MALFFGQRIKVPFNLPLYHAEVNRETNARKAGGAKQNIRPQIDGH
jgi:hypothetical protein